MSELHERYSEWANEHQFQSSALETTALFVGRKLLHRVGDHLDVSFGNGLTADHETQADTIKRPALYGALAIGTMPIAEEVITRELPARLAQHLEARGNATAAHVFRHTIDVTFAAMHAGVVRPKLQPDTLRPTVRLRQPGETWSVPLSQYVAARNYRRIHRDRGLGPAIAAHMVNNGLSFGIEAVKYLRRRS